MKEVINQLANQGLLTSIIEGVPIRIFWKDLEQRYLGCNTLFAKDAGYSCPDDVIGKTDFDMGWKDLAELYRADDQHVMDSGQSKLAYEEPQTTPDGKTIWLRTSKVPYCNESGDTIGVLGVYEDITEQKEISQSLKNSEQRLKQIFENLQDAYYRTDSEGVITMVSPSNASLMACEEEDLLGSRVADFYVDPKQREKFLNELTEGGGVINNFEAELRRFDGEIIWISTSAHFLFDSDGHIDGVEGIVRNISAQKAVEAKLREREKLLNDAQRIAHIGSWYMDLASNQVTWSTELYKMYGFDSTQPVPPYTASEKLFTPESWQLLSTSIQQTQETGTPYEIELEMVRIGGRKGWMLARGEPVNDASGAVVGMRGTAQDITERKTAEIRLKESEARFRDIFENSPDPTWIISDENLFVLCNQAAVDILGYGSVEELTSTHPSKLSPEVQPDGLSSYEKANDMMTMAHTLGVHRFEWEHMRKNGECFPVEVTLARIELNGMPRLYCTWRDITLRKKAESDLLEVGRQYEEAEKLGRLGHWRLDLMANKLHWSQEIYRIFGLDSKTFEASYDAFLNAIHPDDRELVSQAYTESVKNKTGYRIEHRLLMADGSIKWVIERGETSYSEAGEPLVSTGTVLDITPQKIVEEQLRISEERFSLAMAGANDGLWDWDLETDEVYYSPRWFEMLGYEPDDLPHTLDTWASLVHPDDKDRVLQRVTDYLEGRIDSFDLEMRMRHKNGHNVCVLSRATKAIHGTDSKPERLVGTHVDITERKMLEEQLRQAQKMEAIGTLVGGIAHDFNNMLAAVQGNVYLAKKLLQEHPQATDRLDNIEKLSTKAASMVQQLLTFARKDIVQKTVFSLSDFMKEGSHLAKAVIPENIDHKTSICEEPLKIKGDATQLQQVLFNLLNNAVDAVSDMSRPKIRTSLDRFDADKRFISEHADIEGTTFGRITISDNGHGIQSEHMDKIFEPFFTTKEVGKGTGLGLSMLFGAVQTHGGVVEVESKPDQGTAFHIYLPLCKEATTALSEGAGSHEKGKGETILIVDDEDALRDIISNVLESLGYQVLEANNGDEALKLFKTHQGKINLILSDVVMPEMGGIELLKAIRKLDKKVPVILATGYDKGSMPTEPIQDKRHQVINKPFDFQRLAMLIQNWLKSA